MSTYWTIPMANYKDYFQKETEEVLKGWDKTLGLDTLPYQLDWMVVTRPLPCGSSFIMPRYKYNGGSVSIARFLPVVHFPKWRHPIATGRHDYRCDLVRMLLGAGIISVKEAKRLRKIADLLFKDDIALGQSNKWRSKWEQYKGYIGVRFGARLSRRYGILK